MAASMSTATDQALGRVRGHTWRRHACTAGGDVYPACRIFPCVIEIEVDGSGLWLNAKSIVKVLAARIRKGSTLKIMARGLRCR